MTRVYTLRMESAMLEDPVDLVFARPDSLLKYLRTSTAPQYPSVLNYWDGTQTIVEHIGIATYTLSSQEVIE